MTNRVELKFYSFAPDCKFYVKFKISIVKKTFFSCANIFPLRKHTPSRKAPQEDYDLKIYERIARKKYMKNTQMQCVCNAMRL